MATNPRQDENNSAEVAGSGSTQSFPWLAFFLTLGFIPVITILLMEFVVVPNIGASGTRGEATAAEPVAPRFGASAGAPDERVFLDYNDMTANVSGTMGTRFIMVSFRVAGSEPRMREILRNRDAQVRDAIITVLSSQTIQEIEQAGGRNVIRNTLIDGINSAVGGELVEALYFTEFMLQ